MEFEFDSHSYRSFLSTFVLFCFKLIVRKVSMNIQTQREYVSFLVILRWNTTTTTKTIIIIIIIDYYKCMYKKRIYMYIEKKRNEKWNWKIFGEKNMEYFYYVWKKRLYLNQIKWNKVKYIIFKCESEKTNLYIIRCTSDMRWTNDLMDFIEI